MGDRGNIKFFEEQDKSFHFYSHWGGTGLCKTLKDALWRGRDRWDDSSYLARIIFSEMIKGDTMGLTGYGISIDITDNEHKILEVHMNNQTVKIGNKTWSFSGFIENGPEELE